MAKRWERKLTTTEIGFEVLSVEKARKNGFAVVNVKYPTTETIYTYVRRYTTRGGRNITTVDGCEIEFNDELNVLGIKRIYDTAGMKRTTTENISEAKQNSDNSITDKIKTEMEQKEVKAPKVVEIKKPEAEEKPEEKKVPNGPVHHEQYETIKICLQSNIPVYLAGPAGSGKNHTVEQIAEELGWDFYFSNSVQQEYKLTGFIDAGGKFHETEFYKACTSDKPCVFFLDEMDASIPEVLVLLNAAIANGYFEFPTGRVELDNVHFVAAGNTVGSGADEMYTGRMVLDQATLDRFAIIEFNYSLNIEMAISKGNTELVSFIHQLRDEAKSKGIRATFSYRCITMVTKLEKAGMDVEMIIKIAVMKGLDKDTIATIKPNGNTKYHAALRKVQAAA